MDQMQDWEVSLLLEQIQCADRTGWEQARLMAYIQASTWSKKKLKPQDLIKFAWDSADADKENTITETDKANMEKESKYWENWLKKNKNNG